MTLEGRDPRPRLVYIELRDGPKWTGCRYNDPVRHVHRVFDLVAHDNSRDSGCRCQDFLEDILHLYPSTEVEC